MPVLSLAGPSCAIDDRIEMESLMLRYCRKFWLAAVLMTCAASASAMSACPSKEGCLGEWPAWVLVIHELYANYCPSKAALNAAQKEQWLREALERHATPGYLNRLRATADYLEAREKLAAQLLEKDHTEELAEFCREMHLDR